MVITLADLDSQIGCVGHGQVARVCDHDGYLVVPTGQVADPQSELGVLAWSVMEGQIDGEIDR